MRSIANVGDPKQAFRRSTGSGVSPGAVVGLLVYVIGHNGMALCRKSDKFGGFALNSA